MRALTRCYGGENRTRLLKYFICFVVVFSLGCPQLVHSETCFRNAQIRPDRTAPDVRTVAVVVVDVAVGFFTKNHTTCKILSHTYERADVFIHPFSRLRGDLHRERLGWGWPRWAYSKQNTMMMSAPPLRRVCICSFSRRSVLGILYHKRGFLCSVCGHPVYISTVHP